MALSLCDFIVPMVVVDAKCSTDLYDKFVLRIFCTLIFIVRVLNNVFFCTEIWMWKLGLPIKLYRKE